jgi:hypothetical protein
MVNLLYEVAIYYITGKIIDKRIFKTKAEATAFVKSQPRILYRYYIYVVHQWVKG